MTFTQKTFLGASIRGFNGEVGWGEQPTSLTVYLVEDPRNADEFVPPYVGSPVEFKYDDFYFAGILDNIVEENSQGGNRVLTATIVDPRRFLDGIQLIINGYAGPTNNISNLYNIYNYYESIQFGYSRVNNLGMLSELIHSGITRMISEKPIIFAGKQYFIDISSVPIIRDDYRIPQNIISLIDFIQDCCDIGNMDYIVNLVGNVIKIDTINKGYIPNPNAIKQYIDSLEGAKQKSFGLEYNYSPSSKFLIGGPVDTTFFRPAFFPIRNIQVTRIEDDNGDPQIRPVSADPWVDNGTISRFWGEDSNGNLIFGKRLADYIDPDDELIVVSAYEVGLPYYAMTIGELRAAAVSQDAWENFIILNDFEGSLHHNKSDLLKINAEVKKNLTLLFNSRPLDKISPHLVANIISEFRVNNIEREYCSRIYEFVRRYASDYFGVKYSVSIPNVLTKVNQDNFRLKETNLIPTDSGYLEDNEVFYSVIQGLMPEFFTFVQDEQGKIVPYVKFNNYEILDLSSLTAGYDYVIDYDFVRVDGQVSLKKNVFVKCQVDPKIYFGNSAIGEDPRVVITLPDPVYSFKENHNRTNIIADTYLKCRGYLPRRIDGATDEEISQDLIARKRDVFNSLICSDLMLISYESVPRYPDLAVIPLRNTQLTYGPWFATGESGKIEVEQNEDLVPWNFGGFETMNRVGERMVRDILLNSHEGQTGMIDVPGVPNLNVGSPIPGGGPYITGISVNIGQDGVTTAYRYGKWALKTGKMSTYQTERYKKFYQSERERKRAMRDIYGSYNQTRDIYGLSRRDRRERRRPRRERPNSSSSIMMGQSLWNEEEDQVISLVGSVPYYNVGQFISEDFDKKAGMSMDGLFRPFEVNGDGEQLPVYEFPEESDSEEGLDSRDLFPFKQGHDIGVIFNGDKPSDKINNDVFDNTSSNYTENVRGMALKGPLILAGWGYDTNGKPVPNNNEESPTDQFLDGYMSQYNKWKVGPVDLRWDNNKKIWRAFSEGDKNIPRLFKFSAISATEDGLTLAYITKPGGGDLPLFEEGDGEYNDGNTGTIRQVYVTDEAGIFGTIYPGADGLCYFQEGEFYVLNVNCSQPEESIWD